MKRVRLATCGALAWAALAGLGLVSGCQSMDPCGCRPSLLSRFGCCRGRSDVIYQGTPAMPVSTAPLMGDVPFTGELPFTSPGCCDGSALPPSAMPGESLYSGPILGGEDFHGPMLPPSGRMGAPIMMPNGPLPPGGPGNGPPPATLPSPLPESNQFQLTPVPNGGGYAQPIPARPSSRKPW